MSTEPEEFMPDDDVYAASWEAMNHIAVPDSLTPEECHQFWACVETHAYYARKDRLGLLCGDDKDYSNNHCRKQIVIASHLRQDAELRKNAELRDAKLRDAELRNAKLPRWVHRDAKLQAVKPPPQLDGGDA